jgi:hypothetical protein
MGPSSVGVAARDKRRHRGGGRTGRVLGVALDNGLGACPIEPFLVAEVILKHRQGDPGRLRDPTRGNGSRPRRTLLTRR